MDETLDPDIEARAFALEAAMWFYNVTETTPADPGAVVFLAECFVHYLSNGELNAFGCTTQKLRPTVSGGI